MCHEWNHVAASLLRRRASLNIHRILYETSSLDQMILVNDKLKRRLLILDSFPLYKPTYRPINVSTPRVHYFPNNPNTPQVTKFLEAQKKLVITFLEGIASLKSTNIQQVSIVILRNLVILRYVDEIEGYPKLPIQANLTSIKFTAYPLRPAESFHVFGIFFQLLVDSAPNLSCLDISGTLYPNLGESKKLKVLELRFEQCYHGSTELNLTNLTRVLGQVKDSLTELKFHYVGTNNFNVAMVKR